MITADRAQAIAVALTLFYRHQAVHNPPDGPIAGCTCGYPLRLGEPFLMHVFAEIFDAVGVPA